MDVEIVKSNGQKFRLSDYGVVQDFVVNSIDRSVTRESVDGRKGSVDYGTNIGDRSISVPMIFKARDLHDYAHLRDELFGILDDDEPFYIREMRRKDYLQYEFVDFGQSPMWSNGVENEYVNGKHYKVRLDSSISPEQWDDKPNGDITIEFVTSGLPFAESIYTTLELHDKGYSATAEKYGLVDNINIEKLDYRFNFNSMFNHNLIPMKESAWEDGSLYLSNGENSPNTNYLRLKKSESIKITPGETYTINDSSTYVSRVIRIGVFQYKNGVYTGTKDQFFMDRQQRRTFTAVGDEIRISLAALDGYDIPTRFIEHEDERIKLKLEKGDRFTGFKTPEQSFNIYNAGNVKIEPESMMLNIIFNNLNGSKLTLKNKSTDEEFIFENSMPTGTQLRIEGMVVRQNLINRFRDTNKKFISLVPGENQIEISGITFDDVRFEFKYLYK